MLTKDALNSALPLTDALDSANLYLSPIENTPLAALVKATRSDENFMSINGSVLTPNIDDIEYIANKKDDTLNVSPHDLAMDDVVETAVKAVQGHIAFARTVVAPAVQELVERTEQILRDMTPSAIVGMEVVVHNMPAPLQNATFEASVRRFEEVPFDSPTLSMRLPSLTASEIIELLWTGSATMDRDIKEWVGERGEGFFLNIWETIFQQRQAGPYDRVRQFSDYLQDRAHGLDNALAIYLLARRLADEPLEGTEMLLPAYNRLIAEFRNQAGLRLCHGLDENTRIVKNGTLVRSMSEKVTVVNGQVYKTWIEQGGENEVLFGNLLSQPAVITVEQINAKAAQLKAAWNRHCALTATVEANRRFERTKQVLEKHFREQLFAVTEGEEALAGNREAVLTLFKEQLNAVKQNDLTDLYHLCLHLVCRSRFHRTDAEQILEGIDRVKRDNPNLDIREAAAMSVVEYVATWVASQFRVNAR